MARPVIPQPSSTRWNSSDLNLANFPLPDWKRRMVYVKLILALMITTVVLYLLGANQQMKSKSP